MDNPEELATLGTQDEGKINQKHNTKWKNMFLKVNQMSVVRHYHGLLDICITDSS